MPTSYQLLFLCFCSVFSDAKYLPVNLSKQSQSGRFVARIFHGTDTDRRAADLVIDLSGSGTELDCRGSLTQRSVSCPSLQCSKAGRFGPGTSVESRRVLVEDAVAVESQVVDRFLFHCMSKPALRRLTAGGGGGSGVIGLGRSRISLPSQFSMDRLLDRKFTLCLSASGGQLLIGDALSGTETSKTLIYTPLVENKTPEHRISVSSINIQGEEIPVKVNGRAKLSTTAPFTALRSSIYRAFTDKFVTAVKSMNNATKAESVWPFETCFIGGSNWPEVDLVLQSKMVKWRIAAVMVEVGKGVACLGILDGGVEMGDEIVMGRYQLEENVLEFDMARSMLGFGSRTRTCAELKLELEYGWITAQSASS